MKPIFNTVPLPRLILLCVVFSSFACTSVQENFVFLWRTQWAYSR